MNPWQGIEWVSEPPRDYPTWTWIVALAWRLRVGKITLEHDRPLLKDV